MIARSPVRPFALLSALICMLAFSSPVQAGKKNLVTKAFRGEILITDAPLPAPDLADSKGTIKAYKQQRLPVITSTMTDGLAVWNFHFTAFVKSKPKTNSLSLEFYTDDKEKLFVADKRLSGADPNLQILASSVSISEDENINRNRKYILKLVATKGKKSVVLATTKIATK